MNFYMDDSGTRTPDRRPLAFDSNRRDFFALGGVLINEDEEGVARKLYDDFCERWRITYPLHSVEIRHSKKNFTWLKRDTEGHEKFMQDLTRLLTTMNVTGIACVIDRPGYDARYRYQYGRRMWHLCQTAFCIVVERAAKWSVRDARKLRVMPERSSPKDEKRLKEYFDGMKSSGAPFDAHRSTRYAPLDPEQLASTLYELRFKSKSSPMVQIADLFLWPIAVGGYDPMHLPYTLLRDSGRLIECHLDTAEHSACGTKYSCFELFEQHKRRG
jgi:hypothetical protein